MILAGLRRRVGDPLDWDTGLRCAVAAAITAPFTWVYTFVGWWWVAHPDTAPYVDTAFATRWLLPVHTWVVVPAWCALGIAGLVGRARWRLDGVLPHLVTQLYFVWFGVVSYTFGPHTSLYPAAVLLGAAPYTLALFPHRTAVLGIVSFATIVGFTSVASLFEIIPYAPFYRFAPFGQGHVELSWLLGEGGLDMVVLIAGVSMLVAIIMRWQDREERLVQATALLSRYVAAQVMRHILDGNTQAITRHERRGLTLVFTDVCDFSGIAERLEPEELSEMLNHYLSEMATIAETHGGMIDKFVGDVVMVIFGAPTPMAEQEQARQAVRMAIAMQERVAALRAEWLVQGVDEGFRVRIGINTGIASIGNFGSRGRMAYTAIGRQVNLAARLQVQCEPGAILLSHGTWLLVRDEVTCRSKGEVTVKGIQAPVKVYEVDPRAAHTAPGGALLRAEPGHEA